MIKIGEKGEKMSLRKGLTLLLLAAFGFSSIAPAFAATINEGATLPLLTLDAGQKTQGAKPDVDVAALTIELDAQTLQYSNGFTNDQYVVVSATGTAQQDADGTAGGEVAAPNGTYLTYFVPQTGCSFVPLPGYVAPGEFIQLTDFDEAGGDKDADGSNESGLITRNLSVLTGSSATSLSVGTAASENVALLAYILGSATTDVADGNSGVPAGALALFTASTTDTETENTSKVSVRVDNVGIACDAGTAITDNNVLVTLTNENVAQFEPAISDELSERTFTIATTADSTDGKIEVYVADGTLTGTTAEDSESNTLLGSSIDDAVSTVSFGPGAVRTNTASAAIVDIDTIKLRAAERPDSTTTSKKYYQTPVATGKFVSDVDDLSTSGDTMRNADPSTSASFQGASNALITVSLELVNGNDGATDATLTVSDVFVGLFAGSTNLDNVAATIDASGFLGAVANSVKENTTTPDNISAATDASIITVSPANGGSTLQDGQDLAGGLLTAASGLAEAAANGALVNGAPGNFTITGGDGTNADPFILDNVFLFPGVTFDDAIVGGDDGSASITAIVSKDETAGNNTVFTGSNTTNFADNDVLRNTSEVFARLQESDATNGTVYHVIYGNEAAADISTLNSNLEFKTTNLSEDLYSQNAFITGTGPVATVSAVGGTNNGGYNTATGVATTGGSGTGLTVDTTADGTSVTAFTVANAGNGYLPTDTITITGGGANATFTVSTITAEDQSDNMVMASRLVKVGNRYEVRILPFVNKYQNITDNNRDLISIRPKGSIALGTNSKANGVKLLAKVSGNNINGTKQFTLAEIKPTNLTTGVTARVLPTTGTGTQLMVHKSEDPTSSRSALTPTLSTTNNSLDKVVDAIGTDLVLDTTIPPLFAAGTVGNGAATGTRGPIPGIQVKPRAIAIEEAVSGQFQSIKDLGSSVNLRLTLPTGVDIAAVDDDVNGLTDAEMDEVFSSFVSSGVTLSFNDLVEQAQPISSNNAQAFVDLDLSQGTFTTDDFLRGIFFVMEPDALAVSSNAQLGATLQLVQVEGTFPNETITVLEDLGTVNLSDALNSLLQVSISDSATSTFTSGTPTVFVREDVENNFGSQGVTFTNVPTAGKRFVTGTAGTTKFVDIKVTEAVPDAFPIGTDVDGLPSAYPAVANGDFRLYCAGTEEGLFADPTGTTPAGGRFVSDDSISASAPDGEDLNGAGSAVDAIYTTLTAGAGVNNPRAASTTSSVKFTKVVVNTPALSANDVDIYCWVAQREDGNNRVHIATSAPAQLASKVVSSVTEYALLPVLDGAALDDDMAQSYFRDAAEVADANSPAFETAAVMNNAIIPNIAAGDKLDSAVVTVVDSPSLGLFNAETPVNVLIEDLPLVNGVEDTSGDKRVTLCSNANADLEPGTLITITSTLNSGGTNTDSINVPVLADGTFQGVIRAAEGQEVILSQNPTSNSATQIKVVDVAAFGSCDSTLEPDPTDEKTITGPVATLLTSTLVEGEIVVLFDEPTVSGFTFADVAGTATVNNVAVTPLGDKFAAVVPTAATYTLSVVDGADTITAELDVTTVAKTSNKSIKRLRALKTDKKGRQVIRQRNGKLPKDVSLEVVYSDGTTAVVANADLTRNKKGIVKFENPEADKTITYVQVLSAARGSRVAQ